MRVLVVCSGNICRSPMVAEYLRRRAAGEGLAHLVVDSAGTLGIEGEPAAPDARRVASENGLDLARHRSRGLTREDGKTADLVVVMTADHRDEVRRRLRGTHADVVLLRAFEKGAEPTADPPDLDDPVLAPIAAYRACFEIVRTCVDHLVLHLKYRA